MKIDKFTKNELLILKYALKTFKSTYSDNLWITEANAIDLIEKTIDNLVLHKYFKEENK